MNDNWLKELKAGDRVFVRSNFKYHLEVVQRITPTGRVVVNNTQYTNGSNTSNRWNILRLEEATEEKIQEYKNTCFVHSVFEAMRGKKSMTYSQAKQINEILRLGVEE